MNVVTNRQQINMKIATYTLENYKERDRQLLCPACGKRGVYKRYRRVDSRAVLDASVGRCDRESSCGYHKPPREWFAEHPAETPSQPIALDRFPAPIVAHTLRKYEGDGLYSALCNSFNSGAVWAAFEKYLVGTAKDGRTMFWLHDVDGICRSGKVLRYDPETGKRVKAAGITWSHSLMATKDARYKDFKLKPTLFGAHLLKGNTLPVALVESEKTALICSLAWPERLWLATGGCGGLPRADGDNVLARVGLLSGREVYLYPDLDKAEDWANKAAGLGTRFGKPWRVVEWWRGAPPGMVLGPQDDPADYILKMIELNKQFNGPPGWDDDSPEPKYPPIVCEFIARNPALEQLIVGLDLVLVEHMKIGE